MDRLARAEGEDSRAKVLWLIVAVAILPLAIGLHELVGIGRAGMLASVALSGLGFCVVLATVFIDSLCRAQFARGRVLVHCPAQSLSKFTQRWTLPRAAIGSPRRRYWAHIRLKHPDFERLSAWLAEQGAFERIT